MPSSDALLVKIDTSALNAYAEKLGKLDVTELRNRVKRSVLAEARRLRDVLTASTPKDTGSLASGWEISAHTNAGEGIICQVAIVNEAVQMEAIEQGVTPGNLPWPEATHGRSKKVGPEGKPVGKKRSGKTIMSNGRIWSTQAIGGVTPSVVNEQMVTAVAENVMGVVIRSVLNG